MTTDWNSTDPRAPTRHGAIAPHAPASTAPHSHTAAPHAHRMSAPHDHVPEVVEAREARQGLGWSSMPVLAVLAISTLLAVVALGVVFFSA